MKSFAETGLTGGVLEAVKALGFTEPTPIQAATIPQLLASGKDLIASAQTGTGKTAAFGLPAVQLTDVKNQSPQTIILAPTRELCLQIAGDLVSYAKFTPGLNVVAVYGGASIETQIRALKKGAHIVVGTPGRTVDLIKRRKLDLENIRTVVLDESDEMLSMGFEEDLNTILDQTPEGRQMLLFSATMADQVMGIAKRYMNNPERISVAKVNTAAKNVKHLFYKVNAKDRYEMLKRLADINPDIYGIVFARTRREVKDIANKLMEGGYNADTLHGDLSQAQRDEVMERFRQKNIQILVATDVAARGLDVDDLTHVINYNLPDDPEVYVHRSGRTGRAGKSGISIAIVHSREMRRIRTIEETANVKFEQAKAPSGKDICARQLFAMIDKVERVEVDDKQIEPFMPAIYSKLEWLNREELIKHFVSVEFNRFLEYYKGARDINVADRREDRRDKREKGGRNDRQEGKGHKAHPSDKGFAWIELNVGLRQKINPRRLIGMINEGLDSGDAEIGRIELLKNKTFFQIDKAVADDLIEVLPGQNISGVPLEVSYMQGPPPMRGIGKRGGKPGGRSGGKFGGKPKFNKKDKGSGKKGGKKKYRN